MISRRSYITFLVNAGAITLAGCTVDEGNPENRAGDVSGQNGKLTPEPRSVGESITYGGLKMAVTDYETVDEFTLVYSDGDEGDTITAKSEAIFLFVNISVSNVGETERSFPERGGDIELIYKGEEGSDRFTGVDMRADGTMYPNYSRVLEDKGADTGAFPDTIVEGWAIFEVPKGFTESDAVVTIEWGDFDADIREENLPLAARLSN